MRRGATLVELAVALVLFGLVSALIARSATIHERLQRALQAATVAARAERQVLGILSAVVERASAADLVPVATSDSAIELMARVGDGVGCVGPGGLYVPSGAGGAAAAPTSFRTPPHAGDRVLVFDDRERQHRWIARTIVQTASGGTGCDGVSTAAGMTLTLDSGLESRPAVAFIVSRLTRFNAYRSGDGRWYLGMREWNPGRGAFNGVQPVAGPVHSYSVRPSRTGLRFTWLDSAGAELAAPLQPAARVAAVEITVRTADSAIAPAHRVVALRREP